MASNNCAITVSISVQLTEADIPGAALKEPLEQHTVPELVWWLLCRGIRASASWKKPQLITRFVFGSVSSYGMVPWFCYRIQQAKEEKLPVIDVDGTYMFKKQQHLTRVGLTLSPLPPPPAPLSGWKIVNEKNVDSIACNVPTVTSGNHCSFNVVLMWKNVCRFTLYLPCIWN